MRQKKRGLLKQITLLSLIGILAVSIITNISQYLVSKDAVTLNIRNRAEEAAGEVISAIKEYPAYRWLLSCWYENADRLDVEYDVDFGSGTVTEQKLMLFQEQHPDLSLRYLDQEEVEALSGPDQKLYAEIVYSWILTRINETKRNLGCDFLSLVATDTEKSDHPYAEQCFLMSAADPDSRRGTDYEDVYTLGVTVPVRQDSSAVSSMKKAAETLSEDADERSIFGEGFAGGGKYLDYYECLDLIGDQAYLVGVSYSAKDLKSRINIDTGKSTLIDAGYQFLLLQLVMCHVLFYVIQPLKKILRSIRDYTVTRNGAAARQEMSEILSGRKSLAVHDNEVGELAEDFTNLTKEIDEYVENIRTVTLQKQSYETELNIAAQIQSQVLPKEFPAFPERNDFELYATMSPAKEVGGDFYDYFFVDQDHLALVIGDVSDKGVPSALFMMIAKTLIMNHAKMGESPVEVMAHVNEQLSEKNEAGYFVTVWFALIDLRTGEGVSVNAGHEHPAFCRADGSYELIRYRHSMVIGTMSGLKFRDREFKMNPGDRLFVYTDGVPEAINKENEQFGTERMLAVLEQNKDAQPKEILERMKAKIDAFCGDVPQFDDTTMLYFRYNGARD